MPQKYYPIVCLDSPEKACEVGWSAVLQGIYTADTKLEKHFQVLKPILKCKDLFETYKTPKKHYKTTFKTYFEQKLNIMQSFENLSKTGTKKSFWLFNFEPRLTILRFDWS